jgi:hypothetical protein
VVAVSLVNLYFGDSSGNIWQLPYTMKSKMAKPVRIKNNLDIHK